MTAKTPRRIFEGLTGCWVYLTNDRSQYEHALRNGKEIPECCLPGRVIMRLSDEDREVLKGLIAADTQDRQI